MSVSSELYASAMAVGKWENLKKFENFEGGEIVADQLVSLTSLWYDEALNRWK